MVPVIPQKRRDGGSSFDDLVSYIVVRDHEEMDKKYQKVEACELRGSETKGNRFSRIVDYLCKERQSGVSSLEKVYKDGVFQENFHGVTCFHNCSSVETAVDEMQSVVDRKRSTRSDTDPVFHYILSWPEHECPRPEQIQDCIRHTLNRLGLTGHQFMAAVHTDTDNLHVHVAVNRIHPETFRTRAVGMAIDRLHKACRELEIKHGFALTNGNFIVDENQQIVRRSAHERKQLSAWNCDAQENFRNYIRVKTLPFAGKYRSHSWYALHLLMGSRGLKLNRMGNGEVAVCDIRNPERFSVPLSDFGHEWSMSTLTSSVGAWQDAPADILQRLQKLPGYKPVFFEPKTDYAPRPLYRMREKYSLADYACEHIHDAFEKMTWRPEHHTADDLHALFARNGLYLQVQNNELVVCDAYDRKRTPVRAESVHPKLQVPLLADLDGGWKPVPQDIFTQVPPERAYKSEGLERVALSDSERQKVFFGTGPQGAVKREMFSDRESLYGYVVDHCRQKIDDMIREGRFTWQACHEMFAKEGLLLVPQYKGLVVMDAWRSIPTPVRATAIHPDLSLQIAEQHAGPFEPVPMDIFERVPPQSQYRQSLSAREKAVRMERRIDRATERANLRERYNTFRATWQKPDLQAKERYARINDATRREKAIIRQRFRDPRIRRIHYNAAELRRYQARMNLKDMLREERARLAEEGKLHPPSWRQWVEQEALKGDKTAISALRGMAYREKRGKKETVTTPGFGVIKFDAGIDPQMMKLEGATGELRRDGSIVYRQDDNGRVICRDNGDSIALSRDPGNGLLRKQVLRAEPLIFGRKSERFEPEGNDVQFMRSFGYVVDVHNLRDPGTKRYISREDADKYRRDAASRRLDRMRVAEQRRLAFERQYAEEERRQQEENNTAQNNGPRGPTMGR
ncbi:hypothetical protein CQE65_14070 [Salmonella enterica subsp. enterica serovar Typhimurium]|nr:hypothetical protein [Salmonella enterica subsp. enterica serovar Typhimurium]